MLHVFLLGLEILRLVYKKAFFKILNVSILFDLLSAEIVAPPLLRVDIKILQIVRKGYQKKWNFVLISKMCRSLEFSKRGKIFYIKSDFLGCSEAWQRTACTTKIGAKLSPN